MSSDLFCSLLSCDVLPPTFDALCLANRSRSRQTKGKNKVSRSMVLPHKKEILEWLPSASTWYYLTLIYLLTYFKQMSHSSIVGYVPRINLNFQRRLKSMQEEDCADDGPCLQKAFASDFSAGGYSLRLDNIIRSFPFDN